MGNRLAALRILVVDDTAELRYLLTNWLTTEGAEVDTASSVLEAVDLSRT
jgi:CheY-like chemotaxis protein